MNQRSARRRGKLAALLTLCALASAFLPVQGRAQQLQLGQPLTTAPAPPPLPPATQFSPEGIRTALMSVHGFSRQGLDAISIRVPDILMGLIDDAAETVLVRRQAVKALKLYPSSTVLGFLQARLPDAPAPFKVLMLDSLTPYMAARAAELTTLLEVQLQSPDVVVRHAAVSLAAHAAASVPVRGLLSSRLPVEADRSVRSAIETALSAN